MLPFFTTRRRNKLRSRPVPAEWEPVLSRLPFYHQISVADQRELAGHAQVLLAEKSFEGAGGFQVTEDMKVTIAAQAALLLMHRPTRYFSKLRSIILYPGSYVAPRKERRGMIESERHDILDGESWGSGAVVLSWAQVEHSSSVQDGMNLVFHEFAHQLDEESGAANGAPPLPSDVDPVNWANIMRDEFETLREADAIGEETLLDPYGAESPAEFFAVATETFFELGFDLSITHPALYEQLRRFYKQDPASWKPLHHHW